MKLYDFNSAYSLAQTLYGVEPSPTDFEDIALNAWTLINNKHTRLYRYVGDTIEKQLQLPCNVDVIESVHIPIEDAQMTSNQTVFNSIETLFIENYINCWKRIDDPYYNVGKLVKYKEGENTLYFTRDYKRVMVIYHGVLVNDESGLPMITDKEMQAIAAYIGYAIIYKESLVKRDSNLMKMAQVLKADWLKYCSAARVPEHLSQNDMDKVLDASVRWDRKQLGKTFKAIL